VDVALDTTDILAHLIEEEMSLGDMMTLLKLRRGKYSVVEQILPPGARAEGVEIRNLPLPEACVIAAIIRRGELLIPRGVTALEAGDEVLAVADPDAAEELARLFEPPEVGAPDL
jgi:trk system potassium uptake protein TrkA